MIRTGDLDPVYIAIWKTEFSWSQLSQLLLSYWCFYHLGVAAWLSGIEERRFWATVKRVAANDAPSPLGTRWPRGVERRHFRGAKCLAAVEALSKRSPQFWLEQLAVHQTTDTLFADICEWPMFGPWIAYKIADMLERLGVSRVEFSPDVCLLYKEPRASLLRLSPEDPERELTRLTKFFKKQKAPPALDRACGYQEVETILCKYKAFVDGTYWVGKDIHEVRKGLRGWGLTAERMRTQMPVEEGKLY